MCTVESLLDKYGDKIINVNIKYTSLKGLLNKTYKKKRVDVY